MTCGNARTQAGSQPPAPRSSMRIRPNFAVTVSGVDRVWQHVGRGLPQIPVLSPQGTLVGGWASGARGAQAAEGFYLPAVMKKGLQRCTDHFQRMYKKCRERVIVPLIQHFICLPMQFGFLCHSVKRR